MSDDAKLVERLSKLIERQRNERGDYLYKGHADPEIAEAREAITRLTAELAEARGALRLWIEYDQIDAASFAVVAPMLKYNAAVAATRAAIPPPPTAVTGEE